MSINDHKVISVSKLMENIHMQPVSLMDDQTASKKEKKRCLGEATLQVPILLQIREFFFFLKGKIHYSSHFCLQERLFLGLQFSRLGNDNSIVQFKTKYCSNNLQYLLGAELLCSLRVTAFLPFSPLFLTLLSFVSGGNIQSSNGCKNIP